MNRHLPPTGHHPQPGPLVGQPVPRREDQRFLTGRGRYVDDIVLPGQLYAHFVRSPHAHARIVSADLSQARAYRGVVVAYTASDLGELDDIAPNWVVPGSKVKGRPPLARDRVRHHGEAVAVIVADNPAAAADAAELAQISYEPLPVQIDQQAAAAPGAPLVHADLTDNIATRFPVGGGFAEAAAGADLRISFTLRNQRLIPFPLEPRAVNADFDDATGRLTVYCAHQLPHLLRRMLAQALGFPEQRLRVVSPDVGGGFGAKMHFYPEDVVLARLSRKLRRPVKWTETRSENISATTHGRDHATTVDVAATGDGRIQALRVNSVANVGAYLSSMGSGVPTVNVALFVLGLYAIPTVEVLITNVYTNTTPVDAYRGAGRPEAAYIIERAIGRVALELGLDPAEVRRRNFVTPDRLPYRHPTGISLDTGQYEVTLAKALTQADYGAFRIEQAAARLTGRCLGAGLATYTHSCGVGMAELMGPIGFDRGGFESALVRVHPDGRATVLSGSHSHGQGHATIYAQIAADELGLPLDDIEVVQGDTDIVPLGVGTFNSRSVSVGGSAVKLAAARVAAKMRSLAAHMLQSEPADVVFDGGLFRADGNRSVTIQEIGHAAWTGQGIPRPLGIGLEESEFYHPHAMSAPNGAHVALVEVDVETGEIALQRYVAIEDCGVVINPLLARGQIQGGLAQGIGQALFEDAAIDADGAPVPDPPIPRSDMLPRMEIDFVCSPTPNNPLGSKGIGEAGALGAPPAIVNAVLDALWPLGVRQIDMPLTPERVLAALSAAQGARP